MSAAAGSNGRKPNAATDDPPNGSRPGGERSSWRGATADAASTHLPREKHQLEVLYDVTRRLASAHDTDEILTLIVNEATHLLNAEAAGLRLLEGDELVLRARTESAAAVMARLRLRVGESLSGYAVATGQAVVVEDLVKDTRYDAVHKKAALERGFHGFLGVPLRAHNRTIGALNVYTKRRRRFTVEEVSLLSVFADQASLAIDKDRLLREAEGRAIRLQALARVNQIISSSLDLGEVLEAIAQAAAQLTEAPAVAIWTADESERIVELRALSDERLGADYPSTTLRFDEGVTGWVATHRRELNVPDVLTDPRVLARDWLQRHELASMLALPLMFHDSLLGVLTLYGRKPFVLRQADRDLLDGFVVQAAAAVRNARLYQEVRVTLERLERRTRDLDLLNAMGELLAACVTEDEAYTVVARFVGRFFPDDRGAVFVTSASKNLVEACAAWGPTDGMDQAGVFKPEDCWALRRGRIHVVEDTASGLPCKHVPEPRPAACVCIPLTAQGESLGVLHLSTGASRETAATRWGEIKQRLALTVADQLSLSVANLKLRETLRNQSIRDPLTGLFNRRYMEETVERELRRAERSTGSLGVMMCDLDHFKEFNDGFGHEAGDAFLRELGPLLKNNVRAGDIACRYGGEEFALILPDASMETTRQRAERLREAVKALSVTYRGQSIGSITLSVGVAIFPQHGITAEALFHAADKALYRAKNGGRDQVMAAE